MKQEDYELLMRYRLAHLPQPDTCPVCGNKDWVAQGLYYLPKLDDETKKLPRGGVISFIPLAVLNCPNCQFIETFAWLPVVEWGKQNG